MVIGGAWIPLRHSNLINRLDTRPLLSLLSANFSCYKRLARTLLAVVAVLLVCLLPDAFVVPLLLTRLGTGPLEEPSANPLSVFRDLLHPADASEGCDRPWLALPVFSTTSRHQEKATYCRAPVELVGQRICLCQSVHTCTPLRFCYIRLASRMRK